jgi:RimJ/RimL family protein N-acetyltransferase
MDVTLLTRRLVLRQPRPDDCRRLAMLLNNFAVSGKLARVPYPYAQTDAQWWIGTWRPEAPPGETGFVMELAGEGLIGHCGFHTQGCETLVGYWLGEPFWNRGFMSEAAAAAIDWFFAAGTDDRLVSGVFAFNKASLAVQRKLGFTETGISRKHCLARNEELRHIDTELTRAHWEERRSMQRQAAGGVEFLRMGTADEIP